MYTSQVDQIVLKAKFRVNLDVADGHVNLQGNGSYTRVVYFGKDGSLKLEYRHLKI